MQKIEITQENGKAYAKISGFPDTCPVCKNGIFPKLCGAHDTISPRPDNRRIILVFKCPLKECMGVFLAHYEETTMDFFVLRRSFTKTYFSKVTFDEPINELSEGFVSIYNESYMAEGIGLTQVCGCGYRKALEFLIKDYLKLSNSGDSQKIEEIEGKFLGKRIEEDINNPSVKSMAKRAAWLGNDETHYVRIWRQHDIDDLKKLINLTVSYINTELLAQAYINGMPE